MIYKMPPEMAEAARLTRLGRLAEATALVQRLVNGGRASGPARGPRPSNSVDLAGVRLDAKPQGPHPRPRITWPAGDRPRTSLRETLSRLTAMAKAADEGKAATARSPEPIPDGATFAASSYSNAAGTRNYKVYIPSGRKDEPLPLIVMLHGCTQSPDDFASGTRMNSLAEEHGFLVVYPEQSALANPKHCWNWFKPEDQQRDTGEPSLIAGIARKVIRDHNADPERVYVAGLSAGGAAAAIMGEAYPDLFAAVGVHSGLPSGAAASVPGAFDAMRVGVVSRERKGRTVPTIVFHGDKDAVVHPRNGEAVAAQATGSGAALRQTTVEGQADGGHAYSRSIYADSRGRAVCEQWVIVGGGHAWSGGSPSGSHTDPRGPDASREMVRFLFEHKLSA